MTDSIPTAPGLYVAEHYPLGTEANYMPYFLTEEGEWYEVAEPGSGFENLLLDAKQVRELGTLTKLVFP